VSGKRSKSSFKILTWGRWSDAVSRLVSLPDFPDEQIEVVRNLMVEAFAPIFPWESPEAIRAKATHRKNTRARLKLMIESKLPIKLP